jgi:Tn3 transposase DDE domain
LSRATARLTAFPLPGGLVHATDRGRVEHCLGRPGLGTWTVKSNAQLREHITATTNKVEAYNGFARWLNFGGEGVIDTLDPVEQEST